VQLIALITFDVFDMKQFNVVRSGFYMAQLPVLLESIKKSRI